MRRAQDRRRREPASGTPTTTAGKGEALTTSTDVLSVFLDDAEERGSVEEAELEAVAVEHELEVDELRSELAAREIEIRQEDDEPELDLRPGWSRTR